MTRETILGKGLTVAAIAIALLAAGTGRRFGGPKLLEPLADGTPMAVAAARTLRGGVGRALAVVRPDDRELARALAGEGLEIVPCAQADRGMGLSLACGVRASADAQGWLIALADMPYILPSTIAELARCLRRGAALAAPEFRGQRGHPVGIAGEFLAPLLALDGDAGARAVLEQHGAQLVALPVDDPGVLIDIDTRSDLLHAPAGASDIDGSR